LPRDAAFLRTALAEVTMPRAMGPTSFSLCEDEHCVAFGDVLAAIHRLLRS